MGLTRLGKAEKTILKQGEELQKANLKALEYIKFLAARTNTDIKSVNPFEAFGVDGAEEETLITDRREIGKIFLSQLEEKQDERETAGLENMPELVSALKERVAATLDQKKRTLERNIRSNLSRANTYQQRVDEELNQLAQQRVELMNLNGEDPSEFVLDEVSAVLKEGYWVNPVYEDGFLYLNTKNHVVCKHTNKQTKVDITVDMGQLAVKVCLNSFQMWVIPYKNNIRARGHYHPNVNRSGGICWGTGVERVSNWRSELKIGACLKLLFSLLQNYAPDGGPYVPIEFFNNEGKKYGRVSVGLQHPEKKEAARKRKEAKLKADVAAAVAPAPAEEVPEDECVASAETNANPDCVCGDCEAQVRDCGCPSCRERYARVWAGSTPPASWATPEPAAVPYIFDNVDETPAEYTVDVATSDES